MRLPSGWHKIESDSMYTRWENSVNGARITIRKGTLDSSFPWFVEVDEPTGRNFTKPCHSKKEALRVVKFYMPRYLAYR